MGQPGRSRNCEQESLFADTPAEDLIHSVISRKYLAKGPSAASVKRVEYIREVDGPEDKVVEQLMGDQHKGGFEVRRHK